MIHQRPLCLSDLTPPRSGETVQIAWLLALTVVGLDAVIGFLAAPAELELIDFFTGCHKHHLLLDCRESNREANPPGTGRSWRGMRSGVWRGARRRADHSFQTRTGASGATRE